MSRLRVVVFHVVAALVVVISVCPVEDVACASSGKLAPLAHVEKVCGTFQGMTESGHSSREITYHVREGGIIHHVSVVNNLVTYSEVDLLIGAPLCVEVTKSGWFTSSKVCITAQ